MYYIVDNRGVVYGEAATYYEADCILHNHLNKMTDEEIEDREPEIIDDCEVM